MLFFFFVCMTVLFGNSDNLVIFPYKNTISLPKGTIFIPWLFFPHQTISTWFSVLFHNCFWMFFFPISFKTLLYSTKLSFIFSLYFVWKVEEKHFNTVFMLWHMKLSPYDTWTHRVKFFLWVRGRQCVISHEVCVSESWFHWIIQHLSFNDILIGICM